MAAGQGECSLGHWCCYWRRSLQLTEQPTAPPAIGSSTRRIQVCRRSFPRSCRGNSPWRMCRIRLSLWSSSTPPFPSRARKSFYESDKTAWEQQPLAAAAQHARAHLFLVEIENISVSPAGNESDSWGVRAAMRIELWRIADRKLVFNFSFGAPGSRPVTGPLSEMKSIFDEPGALRSRLVRLLRP